MEPPSPPVTDIQSVIGRLKQAIWDRRPILGDIMRKHGDKLLSDYAVDFMDVNPAPGLDERKPEIIGVVEELVEGRLGKDVALGVAKQLRKLALVSTADHHASIDHPFWVNANIISGIEPFIHPDPDLQYLIVFSFASVSVNNASGFSRGILFSSDAADKHVIRLPILPDKLKMAVVYGTRTFTREELTRAEHELEKKEHEGELTPGHAKAIVAFLEEHFAAKNILGAAQLCSQITRINFNFWRKIFHGPGGVPQTGVTVPDLIYLDIETIVTQMLLKRHLTDTTTLLHRVLFDPALLPLVQRHFDNLPGAFSLEDGWGTYMFWGINEKGRRSGGRLQDGKLVFADFSVDWTPEAIRKALNEKKIFPGMLLCYLMVSLYYGMKCLGGFCQVHDLTVLKQAWIRLLEEAGEHAEANAVVPVQTKELGGDGMVLSYLRTPSGDFTPATGIDMALDQGDTSFGKYVELSKRVTLMEMMSAMLPEMYTVLYPESERDPTLLALKPEEILRATGVTAKLAGA